MDAGEQRVKNIARPIRVYRVAFTKGDAPRLGRSGRLSRGSRKRGVWLVGLSAAPLIAIVAIWAIVHGNGPTGEAREPTFASAAILPWLAKGTEGGDDTLTSQLSDEFASKLPAGIREIRFLAPGIAMVSTGRGDPRMIGRELGVRYIVEGEIRQQQDHAAVRVRIVDAPTGVQLWADETDFLTGIELERRVHEQKLTAVLLADAGQRNHRGDPIVVQAFRRQRPPEGGRCADRENAAKVRTRRQAKLQ